MEPKLLTAARFVDSACGISYRYVYSDTEYFRPHFHDYYEVFLLLEGAVTHHVNGHAVPLGRGNLVFIRPADSHDYLLRAGERFSMLNMTATADTVEGLLSYLAEGFPTAELLSAALPPTVLLGESDFQYILTQMTAIRAIGEGEVSRRGREHQQGQKRQKQQTDTHGTFLLLGRMIHHRTKKTARNARFFSIFVGPSTARLRRCIAAPCIISPAPAELLSGPLPPFPGPGRARGARWPVWGWRGCG